MNDVVETVHVTFGRTKNAAVQVDGGELVLSALDKLEERPAWSRSRRSLSHACRWWIVSLR